LKRLISRNAKLIVVEAYRESSRMTTAVASRTEQQKQKELYFYSNLEALMEQKGLSVAELSEQAGVAQSTIRSLIRGRLKRLDSLSTGKLAQFFGCNLDALYLMKWE
jgi:lambda repressor-like predicted transcriptional regulator